MHSHYQYIYESYIDNLKILGYSKAMQQICANGVKLLFEWLSTQNINRITHINNKHITQYFEYLKTRPNQRFNRGLSDAYLNKQFNAIDKLLQFLHQQGFSNIIPPTNHRIKKSDVQKIRTIEPFTQAEIKILRAHIPQACELCTYVGKEQKSHQLRLVFVLFYGCGLRRKEGFKLTAKNINFDRKTLFIEQSKNYKDRIIPLNDKIYEALKNYIYNFRNLQKPGHHRLFIQSETTIDRWLKSLQEVCHNPTIQAKQLHFSGIPSPHTFCKTVWTSKPSHSFWGIVLLPPRNCIRIFCRHSSIASCSRILL